MIFWILIILLLVLMVASVPAFPYSSGWGYSPATVLLVMIVGLLLLWLLGIIFSEEPVDDAAFLSHLIMSHAT